jgi:hypothetical protein
MANIGKSAAQLDAEAAGSVGKKKHKGKKSKVAILQSGRDGGTPELRQKIRDMDAMPLGTQRKE